MTKEKPCVSKETFDEFLAELGILESCEDCAVKAILDEQSDGDR